MYLNIFQCQVLVYNNVYALPRTPQAEVEKNLKPLMRKEANGVATPRCIVHFLTDETMVVYCNKSTTVS